MSAIANLLGEQLLGKDGVTIKSSEIAKDEGVIGLYFSAHWCPPCRGFTPKLAEFYNNFRSKDIGKLLEIVFISSDRDESSFGDYYKDMPWLALPFSEREKKGQLSKKFKVEGIPMLVFINGDTGELITTKGRDIVISDPEGKRFPWPIRSIKEILEDKPLKNKDGEVAAAEATKDKITGLYFSAHWCPPCRGFTPKLISTYNKLKEDGKKFEIIFISSDRSEETFSEYYGDMPWLALPYGDDRKGELSNQCDVSGIPTLIILDENYEVITVNGRGAVLSDEQGKEFPWHKKPLNVLDGSIANDINNIPTLIYFTGNGEADKVKNAIEVLTPTAEAYMAEYKEAKKAKKSGTKGAASEGASAIKELEELNFLYESEESEEDISEAIRNYFKLPDRNPLLVLLDIPEGRLYEFPEGEITKEAVENIVAKFKRNEVEFKPIQR